MKLDDEPEPLDGRFMGQISADFVRVAHLLKQAGYEVRARKISDFPVFPICRVYQPVGSLLMAADELNLLQWHYYLSFLDELVQRGLISQDRATNFQQAYKDPDEFCCLLVIDPDFTNFVFIPYPEEDTGDRDLDLL